MKPSLDPYRVLGVLRGADPEQIKSAHRRLAKRYHPDGHTTDEVRFLAVQEAYQLLSDPLRRREWDRQHAPGPVRAPGGPRTEAPRRPVRRASTTPLRRRGTGRRPRPQRPPGQRKTTWSAEHVPWWEDFDPRTRHDASPDSPSDPDPRSDASTMPPPDPESAAPPDTPSAPPLASDPSPRRGMDFDVFNRSSGAAWSAAARRHFRRGTDDLPSRGAWRYRGTQVVTGAEARKVAAEEEEEKTRR